MLDRLRAFIERLGPRERRLGGWLGVVVIVCGLGYVAFLISDGLSSLDKENSNTRLLLTTLEEKRDQLAIDATAKGELRAIIPDEAPALGSYVEKVASEAGVPVKQMNDRPPAVKGKFRELTSEVTLYDLNVDQLAKLMRGLETTNPGVVVQKLDLRRSPMQKEKIERVILTVATYERVKSPKPDAAAPAPAAETKP